MEDPSSEGFIFHMVSVDSLVSPDHLHFEHSLLKDPDNESLWLDYVELLHGDLLKSQFVLDRAVTRLPASTLLWNAYFLLPWTSQESDKLLSIYKRALVVLGSSPSIWMRYLTLVKESGDETNAKRAFDSALFHLDSQYHGPVWKLYLAFADTLGGQLAAKIYHRYSFVCGDFCDGPVVCIDEVALKLAQQGEFELAGNTFSSLWTTNKPLSQMLSLAVSDYCEVLQSSENFKDDGSFGSIIHDAAEMFPDLKSDFYLKLAQYYASRGKEESALYSFNLGLKASTTVKQVTVVFDNLSEYLEKTISEQKDPDTHRNHHLDIYEKLLKDRPLYINDVKLKQDINLVDYWLERIELFLNMDRKAEMLNTYVKAITSINPLKSKSLNGGTLATIWIQYANVYIAQGDFDTANIIFSRAIKSQFKTVDELVDIHISWAEVMLERSDEDALNHIMELLRGSADVNDDEQNELQYQLARSPKLWEFRLDLLKAISSDKQLLHDPQAILGDMIAAKVITLRILLNYASYLETEKLWDRYFAALELGLSAFVLPDAKYEIWKVYLPKFLALNVGMLEKLREAFERCLEQIPPVRSSEFYLQYVQFERRNKLISRSVRIVKRALSKLTEAYTDKKVSYSKSELNKIADDKYDLYVLLVELISQYLKDEDMCREEFTKAVEDQHLTIPNTVDLSIRFIKFEISNKQFPRVRALFRYATGLANPQQHMMKQVWTNWEEFELENGSEGTYKQMLKYKRGVAKEFESLEDAKSSINPMGFTKASSTIVNTYTANPDAIALDMDM